MNTSLSYWERVVVLGNKYIIEMCNKIIYTYLGFDYNGTTWTKISQVVGFIKNIVIEIWKMYVNRIKGGHRKLSKPGQKYDRRISRVTVKSEMATSH